MKIYYISTDNGGHPELEKKVSPLFSSDEEALIWARLNNKPIEELKYKVRLEIIE